MPFKDPEKRRINNAKYRKKNRAKILAWNREYRKTRIHIVCYRCGNEKTPTLGALCKPCSRLAYRKNPLPHRLAQKKYKAKNREEFRKKRITNYLKNKVTIRAYCKAWHRKNIARQREKQRKYYTKNRLRFLPQRKLYAKKVRDKYYKSVYGEVFHSAMLLKELQREIRETLKNEKNTNEQGKRRNKNTVQHKS